VLYPQAGLKVSRADEGVLALRGTVLGTRVLLLSDLDRTGQRRLLDQTAPEALRADIVITGLPGEGEPLIRDLLRAIQPDLILVGDDEWPSSRRAPQALLARLAETAPVLTTREQGAVKVEFTGAGWHALNATGVLLAKSAQTSGKPEP
jgi:beta-lactamase superfamily II metal-dependent hydrolase